MIIIEGLQEKGLFNEVLPFNVIINSTHNFTYPSHWHNALELIFAQEISLALEVNRRSFSLNQGDLMLIACGDVHSILNQSGGRKLYLQVDHALFYNLTVFENIKPLLNNSRSFSFSDENTRQLLDEHLSKLCNAFFEKPIGYQTYILARLCDIFVLIYQHFLNTQNRTPSEHMAKKLHGIKKLSKAFEYIEKNYSSEIRLKDVAQATGFCDAHFSRIFKEIYGMSFHSFLNAFRIKKAEKLLLDADMSISNSALYSGFNSLTTFNRVFKEIKGCTPSVYIRMKE